jgi:hypothetical protein
LADAFEVFQKQGHAEWSLLDVARKRLQENRTYLARNSRAASQELDEFGPALATGDRTPPIGKALEDEELGDT